MQGYPLAGQYPVIMLNNEKQVKEKIAYWNT